MSSDVSRLLHAETDRLPVTIRPAALVRSRAERTRHRRRASAGAVLCAVAVVLLVASSQLVLPTVAPVVPVDAPLVTMSPVPTPPPPDPTPPDPATQPAVAPQSEDVEPTHYQLAVARKADVVVVLESTAWADRPHHTLAIALETAIPGQRGDCNRTEFSCQIPSSPDTDADEPLVLAADPLLTDAAWVSIAGGDSLARVAAEPAPLVQCSAAPADLPTVLSFGAAYADLPSSATPRATEFILRFVDASAASAAMADLLDHFVDCFGGTPWEVETLPEFNANGVATITGDVLTMWGFDEAYFADRSLPF